MMQSHLNSSVEILTKFLNHSELLAIQELLFVAEIVIIVTIKFFVLIYKKIQYEICQQNDAGYVHPKAGSSISDRNGSGNVQDY